MQRSMVDQATTAASDAVETVKDVAGQAAESADMAAVEIKRMMRTSVTNQPMITLAAAVAIGFVIGALWKS